MSNMDFFIFSTDQAQIKSARFFLQNNLRLRNASRIQEGKQCKTENIRKMVYHAKGMAYKHVNIAVKRRDHAGWLVSNAISESNPNMVKELI